MADVPPLDTSTPQLASPQRARRVPFFQRLRYSLTLHVVKLLISIGVRVISLPLLRNPSKSPRFTKSYPAHPLQTHRVFIPKSHKPGDRLLPLYIHVHGGGFALASPIVDDDFCSSLSNAHNILVVSLDYPKAPTYRFPIAINALTDAVQAVLQDAALPLDSSRVAMGGFSAGASLVLAVCQDQSLQGKIKGLVAVYPPVNFVPKEKKTADTAEIGGEEPVQGMGGVLSQDQLNIFGWGYVEEGQDLTDPRLSPIFANRDSLPPNLYIIGCELDLLCAEAEVMALKMAGTTEDAHVGEVDETLWQRNGVRWEKVIGEDHAFNTRISFGAEKVRMQKRATELHNSVAEWLQKEVYC